VQILLSDFQSAGEKYEKLCQFIGEDKNKMKPDEMFTLISDFIEMLKKAEKDVVKMAEAEEREAQKEQAKLKQQEKLSIRITRPLRREDSSAEIQNLLKSARGGDLFRNRLRRSTPLSPGKNKK